jgi:hypothetical protein
VYVEQCSQSLKDHQVLNQFNLNPNLPNAQTDTRYPTMSGVESRVECNLGVKVWADHVIYQKLRHKIRL